MGTWSPTLAVTLSRCVILEVFLALALRSHIRTVGPK